MNSIKNLMINGVNTSQNTVKKLRVVEIRKSALKVLARALKRSCPLPSCLTSFHVQTSSSSFHYTSYWCGIESRSLTPNHYQNPLDTKELTHENVNHETIPDLENQSTSSLYSIS